MDPKCVHAKNETSYILMTWPFILERVQGWVEQNIKRKVIQFAFFLMLFNKGKPMTKYEDFKPLFSFLKLKNNLKNY
jgi:hypothetical protein